MRIETGTVDITKHFAAPAAAVFAAWSEEAAQRAWGDPGPGWRMAFERFRFAVGESDLCRFGPEGGPTYLNENSYLSIERDRRIVYASTLRADGVLTFSGTVAVTFAAEDGGTSLRLVEHGLYIDGHDSPDDHRAGWRAMLEAMAAYLGQADAA